MAEKQQNWFARHKVLTVFLVLIIFGVIGSASSNNATTTNPQSAKPGAAEPAKPAETKLDLAAFYGAVQNGMTKDQVVGAAGGKQPSNCSQSSIQGLGESEYCMWSDFSNNVSVTFNNGTVISKAKVGF